MAVITTIEAPVRSENAGSDSDMSAGADGNNGLADTINVEVGSAASTAVTAPPTISGAKQATAEGDEASFAVTLDMLQGAWRHSHPSVGRFLVTGARAEMDIEDPLRKHMGIHVDRYLGTIVEYSDGKLEFANFFVSNAECTSHRVVWRCDRQEVTWTRDHDAAAVARKSQRSMIDVLPSSGGATSSTATAVPGAAVQSRHQWSKTPRMTLVEKNAHYASIPQDVVLQDVCALQACRIHMEGRRDLVSSGDLEIAFSNSTARGRGRGRFINPLLGRLGAASVPTVSVQGALVPKRKIGGDSANTAGASSDQGSTRKSARLKKPNSMIPRMVDSAKPKRAKQPVRSIIPVGRSIIPMSTEQLSLQEQLDVVNERRRELEEQVKQGDDIGPGTSIVVAESAEGSSGGKRRRSTDEEQQPEDAAQDDASDADSASVPKKRQPKAKAKLGRGSGSAVGAGRGAGRKGETEAVRPARARKPKAAPGKKAAAAKKVVEGHKSTGSLSVSELLPLTEQEKNDLQEKINQLDPDQLEQVIQIMDLDPGGDADVELDLDVMAPVKQRELLQRVLDALAGGRSAASSVVARSPAVGTQTWAAAAATPRGDEEPKAKPSEKLLRNWEENAARQLQREAHVREVHESASLAGTPLCTPSAQDGAVPELTLPEAVLGGGAAASRRPVQESSAAPGSSGGKPNGAAEAHNHGGDSMLERTEEIMNMVDFGGSWSADDNKP